MSEWKKEPAIDGKYGGCLNCGVRPSLFPADGVICVGFGYAALTKNGEQIWSENGKELEECMTGAQAEVLAAAEPENDWRITLEAPLSGRTYQRHAENEWALIEQNPGFA